MDRNATITELDLSAPRPAATTTAEVIAPPLLRIDRFTIIEQIGSGGMGVVYSAYDPQLDRKVALKLLRPDRWAGGDERARGRVLAEARAMAKLSDPHVVTVYEVGSYDDAIFVAMEFVEGETVRQWLRDATRSWREIVEVFLQLARGVAAVHAAGLVHRDIKLDNMMLRRDGRAQILDFGVAQDLGPGPTAPADAGDTGPETIERARLVGTPGYMAPEQFLGETADARTDQWALSISLFEALYGSKPFASTSLAELAIEVCEAKLPPPPRGHDVPAAVHAVLARGLAKQPDARWPTTRAWLDALASAGGRRRHRNVLIAGASTLVIGLGVAIPVALREPPCNGAPFALARVWYPERGEQIAGTFAQVAPSFGADAWQRTAAVMQRYGEGWTAEQRDACEAERTGLQTPHVHDLRVRCLERGLGQLDALLDALEHADLDAVQHAVDAAARLPDVAECRDVEALIGRDAPPPVDQAEEVDALQRELDRAQAMLHIHRAERVALALASVRPRIEALGYPPLLARLAFIDAGAEEELGHYDRAGAAAEQAYFGARSTGDRELAAIAAARRAWVLHARANEIEGGTLWLALAEAEMGTNATIGTRLRVIDTRASLLHAQGRDDEALALWESMAPLFDELGGLAGELERATVSHNIAVALMALGRSEEAVELARAAVATSERFYGPDHPDVASSLTMLGAALELTGDYGAASAAHRRAVEIRERALGPDHPLLASSLTQLASTMESLQPAQTEPLCRRALTILEHNGLSESREAAVCTSLIAWVRYADHDEAGAHELFARAAEIYEAVLGPDNPQLGAALSNLGASDLRLGALADAEAHLRRAIEVQGSTTGGLGFALANLGETLVAEGRTHEGVEMIERALERHRADNSPAEVIAGSSFKLAKAIVADHGDMTRVQELLVAAREGYRRAQPPRTAELERLEDWAATLPRAIR